MQHTQRRATKRDLPFIIDLAKKFSNQVGFLPRPAFEEIIANKTTFLTTENEDPAGYLLTRFTMRSMPHVANIIQAAVCLDAQRRQHAAQLVNLFTTAAKSHGAYLAQCWCREDIDAVSFWTSIGFRPIALRDPSNADARRLILFRKPLVPVALNLIHQLPTRSGWKASRTEGTIIALPAGSPKLVLKTAAIN